jgi:hypothetical protein
VRNLTHLVRYLLGRARAETQTSDAEREAIARWASGRRCCVEIGVWHGVNTRRIRDVMAQTGVLTGVDPFPRGRLGFSIPMVVARREIARSANGRFRHLRMTGAEAARSWQGSVDFLFIDGDHSWEGLRADWEGWSPHLVSGGIVCLHDSRSSASHCIADAGSVRYTRDVIVPDPRFRVAETVETLTVLERLPGHGA